MVGTFLVFLLFCLTTAAQNVTNTLSKATMPPSGITDADRLTAAKNRATLGKIDRYRLFSTGFSLEPAPNRFCGASDSSSTCDWPVYIESVLLVGALALAVAGVALITCPIFWALRCCGCCGSLKKTHGSLCRGEERTEPYSQRSVWMVRCGTLMLAAVLFVAFIIMQVGNTGLSNGLTAFVDQTVLSTVEITDDLDDAVREVDSLAMRASMLPGLNFSIAAISGPLKANLVNETKSIVAKFADVGETVKTVDAERSAIQLASGLCSLFLVVIAALGGICSFPVLAKVLGVLGFVAFAIAWVSFAINYSVAVVIADFCNELDRSSADLANPAVQLYANCSSFLGVTNIKSSFESQLNRSAVALCASVGRLCDANNTQPCATDMAQRCPIVACSLPPSMCSRATLANFSSSTINDVVFGCVNNGTGAAPQMAACPRDPSQCMADGLVPGACLAQNRTLTACATACVNPAIKSIASQVVLGTTFLADIDRVIVTHIDPLLSCQRVKLVLDDAKDFVCVNALSSFYSIAAGTGLTGCFFAVAIVFGVLGSKRFTRDFRQGMEEFRQATMQTLRGKRGGANGGKSAKERAREERSRRMSYAPDIAKMESEW